MKTTEHREIVCGDCVSKEQCLQDHNGAYSCSSHKTQAEQDFEKQPKYKSRREMFSEDVRDLLRLCNK